MLRRHGAAAQRACTLFGPRQLVEPFAQTRSLRIKFELVRGSPLAFLLSLLICLLRLKSVAMWRIWVGPPTISRSVDLISSGEALLRRHTRHRRLDVPPERRR